MFDESQIHVINGKRVLVALVNAQPLTGTILTNVVTFVRQELAAGGFQILLLVAGDSVYGFFKAEGKEREQGVETRIVEYAQMLTNHGTALYKGKNRTGVEAMLRMAIKPDESFDDNLGLAPDVFDQAPSLGIFGDQVIGEPKEPEGEEKQDTEQEVEGEKKSDEAKGGVKEENVPVKIETMEVKKADPVEVAKKRLEDFVGENGREYLTFDPICCFVTDTQSSDLTISGPSRYFADFIALAIGARKNFKNGALETM